MLTGCHPMHATLFKNNFINDKHYETERNFFKANYFDNDGTSDLLQKRDSV
jgi:hypothetical protein